MDYSLAAMRSILELDGYNNSCATPLDMSIGTGLFPSIPRHIAADL